jgi:ketosteroid isomerase-like protein
MIKTNYKAKLNTKKVQKNIQKANFKSVEHAAAAIRLTAIRLIRTGKKKDGQRIHARPGEPPKKWTNKSGRHIKRSIGYTKAQNIGLRGTSATVYASPEESGDQIYKMHEYGGSQHVTVYRDMVNNRKNRRERDGSSYRRRPMDQRSPKEKTAIQNYYKKIVVTRMKVKKMAHYKARPFLDPAVKKNLSRIPEIWKSNIKKYFH